MDYIGKMNLSKYLLGAVLYIFFYYRVHFVPNEPGKETISVKYGDEEVPNSPVQVKVLPDIDTSSVKTYGPGVEPQGVIADVDAEFTVDAKRLARRGGDHINAVAVGPSKKEVPVEITDNHDGTYAGKYSPVELGKHLIKH